MPINRRIWKASKEPPAFLKVIIVSRHSACKGAEQRSGDNCGEGKLRGSPVRVLLSATRFGLRPIPGAIRGYTLAEGGRFSFNFLRLFAEKAGFLEELL